MRSLGTDVDKQKKEEDCLMVLISSHRNPGFVIPYCYVCSSYDPHDLPFRIRHSAKEGVVDRIEEGLARVTMEGWLCVVQPGAYEAVG